LKSYEELLMFEDLQEFFDDLGILSTVLSESKTEVEYLLKLWSHEDKAIS